MKCTAFRKSIHEFLDCRLEGRMMLECDTHLAECASCRRLHSEFVAVRELLAERIALPAASARLVAKEVRSARHRSLLHAVAHGVERFRSRWRDLEPRFVWAKLSAIPISLSFFLLMMHNMTPLRVENLNLLAISLERIHSSQSQKGRLEIRNVEFRQDRAKFRDLMDTAWKLPYEDSLSLVAGITPEGRAQIDNILEYPKSDALLDAVDVALRESQITNAGQHPPAFLIFSFQKIDVYEDARGL